MPFRSPFPDVEVPNVSLYDHLFATLTDDDLSRIVAVDGSTGAELTYQALRDQVLAIAGALAQRGGVKPGDVVALHSPNSPAFLAVFHGILRAGATVTTVNTLGTAHDVATQLVDSGANLLITVSGLLEHAIEGAVIASLPSDRIFVIDQAPDHLSIAEFIALGLPAPDVSLDPTTHVATLPYSSGTTSKPKGVMLTHRNLVANICQAVPCVGVTPEDRVLAVLPFFHIYGMTVLLNLTLHQRATLVTMPRFEFAEFLRVVEDHRCSYLFIAPPVALALAKQPAIDCADFSSVHTILSGAAPLDGAVAHAVAERLGCRVRQGYGMTEMSPISHVIPLDRDDIPVSTVGVTVPNMESMLIDPLTGEEIDVPAEGTSEPGELLCRGPNVMLGYLNNPEATSQMLREDGFLHTGDVATVSAEGNVTVVDRLKELIKYKGYQVAPAELEAVLLGHPEITDAAVIAGIDETGEEVPKAFIVVREGSSLDPDQVIAFVAERVSPHKKVRQVAFISAVPKSASGKILRKDLRAADSR